VNFRAFAWVLIRETLATVLTSGTTWPSSDGRWRRTIAIKPTSEVKRLLALYLERHPERRYIP